jgi:hypothetical protein
MSQQATTLLEHSVTAAGVIAQRRCVTFGNLQATVAGSKVLGVAVTPAAAAGAVIPVAIIGTCIIETGGVFAIGATLITDNQGRAVANTGALALAAGAVAVTSVAVNGATDLVGSDLPEFVIGIALQASAAAGSFIEMKLP